MRAVHLRTRAATSSDAVAALAQPGAQLPRRRHQPLDLMKGDVEQPAALVDINRAAARRRRSSCPTAACASARWCATATRANHPLVRERYPLLVAGAARRRVAAAAQHGDGRRQPAAAHALLLLLRHRLRRVQQARARLGLRGARRLQPHPRDPRRERAVHRDASLRHGGRAGGARRRRATCAARSGDARDPARRLPSPAGRHAGARHRPRARRADHRRRSAAAAVRRALRTTSRCATARATRSRWCRWRPRSTCDGGTVRDARIALGGVAHKPWRAREAEHALVGKPLDAPTLRRAPAQAASRGARPLRDNAFKVELAQRAVRRAALRDGRRLSHERRLGHRTAARPRRRPAQGHRPARATPPSSRRRSSRTR